MNKLKTLEAKSEIVKSKSSKIRLFLDSILDPKSFVEMDVFMSGNSFIDGSEAVGEGVVTGYASINDESVYLFAENQEVLKGSFGKAHADKIIKSINLAVRNSTPIIAIIDSNGARVGEGVAVLEAYSSMINAITIAKREIPVISIIKGNCVGLMSAVPALSDFVFVSDEAVISLGSPSVVAAKAKSNGKLNEILGAKELSATSNLINFRYKDVKSLRESIVKIINICNDRELSVNDDPNRVAPLLNTEITVKGLIDAVCDKDSFISYSADFAKDLVCGFGTVNGIFVGLLITDSKVNSSLSCNAIKKMGNFVELLDKYSLPMITLVDSDGVDSTLSLEQSGIARDFANVMMAISESTMPKIAIIYGKAVGASYSLLASKSIGFDYVLALTTAEITPIDAAVAVNIVYSEDLKSAKDPVIAREALMKKYSDIAGDPFIAAKDGYIDNIIEPSSIRPYIASALLMLLGL